MKKESLLVFGLLLLIITSGLIPIFTQNDIKIQNITSNDKLKSESRSIEEVSDDFLYTKSEINIFNNSELNLTSRDPIKIDSNDDFNKTASEEGWNGSGSEINPYIINNYKIDAIGSSHGIYIGNTTYHFEIKNCHIYNATNPGKDEGYGLHLFNVTNGRINNIILEENFKEGIKIKNSLQIKINENIISNNQKNGISINNSSSITADSNSFFKNMDKGINIEQSNDLEFTSNKIQNNKFNGVVIKNSEFIDIKNNQINETRGPGILLHNSNNNFIQNNNIKSNDIGLKSFKSEDDKIKNNNISNNDRGIILELSLSVDISNNKMKNNHLEILYGPKYSWNTHSIDESNTIDGKPILYLKDERDLEIKDGYSQIILANCTKVKIENLSMTNIYSIDIGHSNEINIQNNRIEQMKTSIRLISTSNTDILNNKLIENDRGLILFDSNKNTILNNKINLSTREGIHIGSSYNNILSNNTIIKNDDNGIEISNSIANLIKGNLLINNNKYGVKLDGESQSNLIYNNSFLRNNGASTTYNSKHVQAYGNGKNYWNSTSKNGNYWRDWTNPDSDNDAVVDTPYELDGDQDAKDYYPSTKSSTPLVPTIDDFNLTLNSGIAMLSWKSSLKKGYLDVDQYWIYREDPSGITYYLGNISANKKSFNDSSLEDKGIYTYYVYSVNVTSEEVEGSLPSERLSLRYIPKDDSNDDSQEFPVYMITAVLGLLIIALVTIKLYMKVEKSDREKVNKEKEDE